MITPPIGETLADTIVTSSDSFTSADLSSAGIVTLNDGTVTFASSGSWGNDFVLIDSTDNTFSLSGYTPTLSGVISGDGALTVSGTSSSDVLTLTGDNTYTGATSISSATLVLSGSSSSSSFTVDSDAILEVESPNYYSTITYNVEDNGQLILDAPNTGYLYSGTITGSGTVEIASGLIAFSADNTYTGDTTIDPDATLYIGNATTTGDVGGDIVDNGTLAFNHSSGTSYTYDGVISGSGTVYLFGGNTVTLTGENTYTGTTTISSSATLIVGDGSTSGSIIGDVVDYSSLKFDRSDSYTYAGDISGSGSVYNIGGGTITFTGSNSNTGNTYIDENSTLQAGSTTALSSGSLYYIYSGSTLDLNDYDSTVSSIYGAGSITLGSADLTISAGGGKTFSGVISGDGGLTLSKGYLYLTGDNTYTGDTTIGSTAHLYIGYMGESGSVAGDIVNSGSLIFSRSDGLTYSGVISGGGTVGFSGGGTFTLTGDNTYTGDTTIYSGSTLKIGNGGTSGSLASDITNSGSLKFDRSDSYTYANIISGSGSVEIADGTLIVTDTNTYTGGTTIDADATLQIGDGSSSGSGSVTGDIANSGSLIFDRSGALVFNDVISGSGSLTLSSGTLYLTDDNTYTGGTTIDSDTLLVLGFNNTSGSVTGNIVDNGGLNFYRSDGLTYSDVISGTGQVYFDGSSTYTLTGTNTYTGDTTIYSGTTLQLGDGGTTGSITSDVADYGSLVFDRSDSTTYAGDISGNGTVEIACGTTIFTGSNRYTGATTIDSGATLQIGNGGTTGAIVSDVANSGSLIFDRSDSYTYAGTISGDGSLTLSDGTLYLTDDNTYTGGTTIDSGATLQIGDGGTTGAIVSDVANSGSLIFERSDADVYAGTISGTGTLEIAGGTFTLTGENTYTGETTIDSGATLQIGSGGTEGAIAGDSDVVNNGTLAFNRSDAVGVANDIEGTGNLTIDGGGTFTLTGTNTYTGETTITDGTLTAGSDGALSASSAYVLSSSGTLELNSYDTTIVSLSSNGDDSTTTSGGNSVSLGSGTLTVTGGGDFSGVIEGTGGVTVAGGTLTLTGENTYTGDTAIESGATLAVGDDETTGSVAGNVIVETDATLSANGTVGGDVDNTGGGTVSISAGAALTVDGDYTQGADSTLSVSVSTDQETAALTVDGTATLDGTLDIDFADGTYTGSRISIVSAESTSGTFSAVDATGLSDSSLYTLDYDSGTTVDFTTADSTTVDLTVSATDLTQVYSDLITTQIESAHALNDMVLDHEQATEPGVSLWGNAFGGDSKYDALDGRKAFDRSSTGVIAGADYVTQAGRSLTAAVSYHQDDLSVSGGSSYGRADTDSMNVAVKAATPLFSSFRLSGDLFYTANDSAVRRDGATASPDSELYGGALQIDYPLGRLLPLFRVSYAHASRDQVTESGDGDSVAVASRTYDAFRYTLAVRYRQDVNLSSGKVLTPEATLGVESATIDASQDVHIALAGDTQSWVAPGYADPDEWALKLGLGASLKLGEATALTFQANGRAGEDSREGELAIGASFRF